MLIGHENKTDTKDDIMVKKTIAAFFTVLVLSSALTACNTTRGVGQDISEGGSAAINAVDGTVLRRTVLHFPHPVGYTHCDFSSTLRDDP